LHGGEPNPGSLPSLRQFLIEEFAGVKKSQIIKVAIAAILLITAAIIIINSLGGGGGGGAGGAVRPIL